MPDVSAETRMQRRGGDGTPDSAAMPLGVQRSARPGAPQLAQVTRFPAGGGAVVVLGGIVLGLLWWTVAGPGGVSYQQTRRAEIELEDIAACTRLGFAMGTDMQVMCRRELRDVRERQLRRQNAESIL